MFKLIVLLAAIIVITTQWKRVFTDIVDVSKTLEVTSEIITKVKDK